MDFVVFCLFLSYPVYRLVRHERMKRYFASPDFLAQKQEVAAVVAEHNEISAYVAEIRESGNFSIGRSSTGSQAVFASYNNTSRHNYNRNRNVADYASSNVHNCGLQVVRNASADPIKYLIKYFDIAANEEKLGEIENMGESISRLENALQNLESREVSIARTISPPDFIVKYYFSEFQAQIGLSIPKLTIPYPNYVFQYVSAGGNSSQETRIKLDSPTIDALIQALSEKIKFKKSAAGQRSLMTARFREFIKSRDNYACRMCKVSIHDQTHLLLEVDHIMPVSKGGLSIEENLQTLCWKCNRSKSNKY
jgi:hypothetical protein